MGSVILWTGFSLDGFMEGPDRDISWHRVDEELHRYFNDELRGTGAFAEGRRTYELMEGYWPAAGDDPESSPAEMDFAGIWRDTPKYVYSRTLDTVGPGATLLREIDADHVRSLAEQHGTLIVGSGQVGNRFLELGLVDVYRLFVHPVILGAGTPAFGAGSFTALRLVESRSFPNGVVALTYVPE